MTESASRPADDVQILQARGAIYRLLAKCFYAPTHELLEELQVSPSAPLMQNLLDTFQVGTLEEMLARNAEGSPGEPPDGSPFQTLKEEYVRLFEGPGHMEVAPYESVHRKDVPEMERGLVMGASTVDARRRYAEAGLEIAKTFTDLPDHVAVELEFMSYLCFKQAETGADGDGRFAKAHSEFLNQHLLKWMPDFCEEVVAASKVRFYRDLARVTSAYIASEAAE